MKATKQNIRKQFEIEANMTLTSAMTTIMANMKRDQYNNDIRTASTRLFYTDNANFEGGKANGGGKGFYFAVRASALSTTIKIK